MTIKPAYLPLLAAALLGGCAIDQPRNADAPDTRPAAVQIEPPTPSVEVTPAGQGAPMPAVLARDLGGIVELLEDGRNDDARAALVAYIEREPGSAVAKSLLQQLDADPVAMLGKTHRAYVVQAGDTLGGLAARYLGDPMRFVALARYNGLSRPKALRAGQTLKIPTDRAVAPSSTEQAEATRGKGDGERGPDGGEAAQQQQQRGLALMREGKLEAAYQAFGSALAQAPELEPARRHKAELGKKLVAGYHETAVVHFRNQRLDEAIALWDKALALDPAFEPARGYRARALELKRRLKQLDGS